MNHSFWWNKQKDTLGAKSEDRDLASETGKVGFKPLLKVWIRKWFENRHDENKGAITVVFQQRRLACGKDERDKRHEFITRHASVVIPIPPFKNESAVLGPPRPVIWFLNFNSVALVP